MHWKKLFDSIIANGCIDGVPLLVTEMMRAYKTDWRVQSAQSPYPVLEFIAINDCTTKDIIDMISWLQSNGMNKFIVVDTSTCCMRLLYNILCVNNIENCDFSVRIKQNYYKYCTSASLYGIIVNIERRKVLYETSRSQTDVYIT